MIVLFKTEIDTKQLPNVLRQELFSNLSTFILASLNSVGLKTSMRLEFFSMIASFAYEILNNQK